ncbi:MAG: VOC family protein [Thermodesulfobacteriota bacterium]|jgi:catechol 2,3-dioxygenase-like lactoylglutathione lyase family enzyme
MLQRLFHVNICVRDMERSIRFYESLGFKKVNDFTLDDPNVGDALGLKAKKLRGVFMRLGDDPNAPVLDLVQFIDPPPQGQPYPTLNNIGICRIAFTVENIDQAYEQLKAKGVEFVAPLKKIAGPGGATIGVVCFKDPDGTVLELLSGM